MRPETTPIPMRLPCPECGELHIDEGAFATKPHHTHACQHCGNVWRPAIVATVGVRFLPGFRNEIPFERATAGIRSPRLGYDDLDGVHHPSPMAPGFHRHADECMRCDDERRAALQRGS